METLGEFLHIDNHRKHGAESLSHGIPEMNRMMVRFFRKGEVGDWKNYIDGEKEDRWNAGIDRHLAGTGTSISYEIKDESNRG